MIGRPVARWKFLDTSRHTTRKDNTDTNHFNAFIQQAVGALAQLQALPAPLLVGLTCIVVGYVLKRSKWFPNDGIPLLVVVWGAFFTLFLSGNCPPDLSLRQWRCKNALIGLVVGFAAWTFHYYMLSKLEDKFPRLSAFLNGNKTGNADSGQSASEQKQTDQGQVGK